MSAAVMMLADFIRNHTRTRASARANQGSRATARGCANHRSTRCGAKNDLCARMVVVPMMVPCRKCG